MHRFPGHRLIALTAALAALLLTVPAMADGSCRPARSPHGARHHLRLPGQTHHHRDRHVRFDYERSYGHLQRPYFRRTHIDGHARPRHHRSRRLRHVGISVYGSPDGFRCSVDGRYEPDRRRRGDRDGHRASRDRQRRRR